MGPPRKSRSVNKSYSYINELSPSKDGDSARRINNRKRKLSGILGSQWSQEELIHFYEAYRKYGKDWKKVSAAVRNRSFEMVEALYTMNRAYLSLPEGISSKAGLIAMMTGHYSNLAGSDSEQESNDGAGSSRKTQKRARGKVLPTTSKVTDEKFVSHSQTVASNYGCLSLLKKKRSGGTRPRPVGKRTPRFPVSFSGENNTGIKYFSPTRQGLKIKANADDDEVAHEIAIALAEASQRGGSPQVSRTPSRRTESVMSSTIRSAQRKHSVAERLDAKIWGEDMDEEDLEGSTEGDTGELFKHKPSMMETGIINTARQKGRKLIGKKFEVDDNNENNSEDIKEECSGTEEGLRLGEMKGKFDVEVTDAKILRSTLPSQRKKSKKVLFKRDDEGAAFDALKALADLSLMMSTENEDGSIMPFKDEDGDHGDESGCVPAILPAARPKKIVVKDTVEMTLSSLDVMPRLADPRDKGKGKLIETDGHRPKNAIQKQIDMLMVEVNDHAEIKIKFYDQWMNFRYNVLAVKLKHKKILERFISLERAVFKAVKAVSVAQALERRTYLFNLMRIQKMSVVCAELRSNYNPSGLTAYNDRAVFRQLDLDLIQLQMQVKFWEQGQELYIAHASNSKSEKKKHVEETFAEAQAAGGLVTTPNQLELTPAPQASEASIAEELVSTSLHEQVEAPSSEVVLSSISAEDDVSVSTEATISVVVV